MAAILCPVRSMMNVSGYPPNAELPPVAPVAGARTLGNVQPDLVEELERVLRRVLRVHAEHHPTLG